MEKVLRDTEKELLFAKVSFLIRNSQKLLVVPALDEEKGVAILKKMMIALDNLKLAYDNESRKRSRLLKNLEWVKEALNHNLLYIRECYLLYLEECFDMEEKPSRKDFLITIFKNAEELVMFLHHCVDIREWHDYEREFEGRAKQAQSLNLLKKEDFTVEKVGTFGD